MSLKASRAKRPTHPKTKAVFVTRIPQGTVSIPPQGTALIPPRDIVPVPLQDNTPRILQDTVPEIPHNIISEILDHLTSDSDLRSLRACALVSGSWVQPCQRRLFRTTIFTPANACTWLKTFPVQEDSPAHHVRDLRLKIGQSARILEEFFECIPWFTSVDRISLLGHGGFRWDMEGFRRCGSPRAGSYRGL